MHLAQMKDTIQRVSQCAPKHDGSQAHARAEPCKDEGEDKNSEREIREEMLGVSVQRQRGDRPPPFSGTNAHAVRHARTHEPLGERPLQRETRGEAEQRHGHGKLRDAQGLDHEGRRTRLFFTLVFQQRRDGAIAIAFQHAEHVLAALAQNPMRLLHRGDDQPTLARIGQPFIPADLGDGSLWGLVVKNWRAQALRCCPSLRL
jgi:hypothetical protein